MNYNSQEYKKLINQEIWQAAKDGVDFGTGGRDSSKNDAATYAQTIERMNQLREQQGIPKK